MKIQVLRKEENYEYIPIIKDISCFCNSKLINFKIVEKSDCNADIYIIFSDDFDEFIEFYNVVPKNLKSRIMLFTNNIDRDFIVMCLKFINNIVYIKINPKFVAGSFEYEIYRKKNTKRLIKNILNFASYNEIFYKTHDS